MDALEIFIDFIDQIYYFGYASQLAEFDPDKFNWEYNEFLNIYGTDL